MSDLSDLESSTYKEKCEAVEEKLESLVYENELIQKQLDTANESLFNLNEEKRALLDKLIVYENLDAGFSDSQSSASSDDEVHRPVKKSKPSTTPTTKKRPSKSTKQQTLERSVSLTGNSDGHMTPEEVERHLEARRSFVDLALPARTPLTVPNEMFSPGVSCDSDSNEPYDEDASFKDTSPSNMGEDLY